MSTAKSLYTLVLVLALTCFVVACDDSSGSNAPSEDGDAQNGVVIENDKFTKSITIEGANIIKGQPPQGAAGEYAPQLSQGSSIELRLGAPFAISLECNYSNPDQVDKAILHIEEASFYVEVPISLKSGYLEIIGSLGDDENLRGKTFTLHIAAQTSDGATGQYRTIALNVVDMAAQQGSDFMGGMGCEDCQLLSGDVEGQRGSEFPQIVRISGPAEVFPGQRFIVVLYPDYEYPGEITHALLKGSDSDDYLEIPCKVFDGVITLNLSIDEAMPMGSHYVMLFALKANGDKTGQFRSWVIKLVEETSIDGDGADGDDADGDDVDGDDVDGDDADGDDADGDDADGDDADGDSPVTLCTPGQGKCISNTMLEICSADGMKWGEAEECPSDDLGTSCVIDACLTLCEKAERLQSNIGCEYWPVTLPNPQLDDAFKQGDESEFGLFVSNPHPSLDAQATISTPGYDDIVAEIPSGENVTIRLPYRELANTDMGNVAFKLVSTLPVLVVQFNPLSVYLEDNLEDKTSTYAHTNDASSLLPEHIFSQFYTTLAYRPMAQGQDLGGGEWQFNGKNTKSFITIVGTSPGATVVTVNAAGTIQGSDTVSAIAAGAQQTYTLNQFDVLQLTSDPLEGDSTTCFYDSGSVMVFCLGPDLSGSTIESDKPVAVYSGNECQFVPHTCWACDHLESQMPPESLSASKYIAAKAEMPATSHSNVYKFLALEDGVALQTDPVEELTKAPEYSGDVSCARSLSAGDYCMIETVNDFTVSSYGDKKFMAVQFLVGQNYTDTSAEIGDPSMFMIPPVEGFSDEIYFITPDTYQVNYITVYAIDAATTVSLDGSTISDSFTQVGSGQHYTMRIEVTDGTHKLEASHPIGVVAYGFDLYVSYAYAVGYNYQHFLEKSQ